MLLDLCQKQLYPYYQVYVNGARQIETTNYYLAANGNNVNIAFEGALITDDNVIIDIEVYTAQ